MVVNHLKTFSKNSGPLAFGMIECGPSAIVCGTNVFVPREAIIELTEKEKIEQEDWKHLVKRILANILVLLRWAL